MQTKIHYSSCPLCAESNILKQFDINDLSISHEDFEIWDCQSCGFRFTQNVPNQSHAGPYYESEDYVSHSDNTEGFIHKVYHIARRYMLKSKRSLVSRHANGKSLLDIGSGTGYFPAIMKEAGYEVMGVEINDSARAYSKQKFGINVVKPAIFENKELNKKFDIITMWHVLEHVYDMHGYISNIHDILNDNGHIIIALPNYKSYDGSHYNTYWAGYDVPRHLWHFTAKDIQFIANKHGYELKTKKRMPLDSFYVSLLSEKYKKSKLSLIKGFIYGKLSYINSLMNVDHCSSIIYVLKKK